MNQTGAVCGTILWESKQTKTWSDGWLAKLRPDQRAAKADMAVIVSQALPKGVKQFELIDGVYVVSPQCVRPVAEMLRGLLTLSESASTAENFGSIFSSATHKRTEPPKSKKPRLGVDSSVDGESC
jgi:hypothetical protein